MPAASPGLASLWAPLPSAFFLTFSQNSGLRIVGTHLGSKPLASSAVGIARTHDNFRPSLHVWRGPLPFAQEILGSPGFLLGPRVPIHLPAPLPPAQGTLSESPWRSSICRGAMPGGLSWGCLARKAGGASSAEAQGLFQAQLPSAPAAGPALAFPLSHAALQRPFCSDIYSAFTTQNEPNRAEGAGGPGT